MTSILRFLSVLVVLIPSVALAGISSFPWVSSFNTAGHCGEWTQSDGYSTAAVDCEEWSLSEYDHYCHSTGETQITTAANYSSGAGGRGWRVYYGTGGTLGVDHTQSFSGVGKFSFDTNPTHIWIRFYMRFESGTPSDWHKYHKIFYIFDSTYDSEYIDEAFSTDTIQAVRAGPLEISTYWFEDVYGGATSDGSWACYEFEFDIPGNTIRFWVDGVLRGELDGTMDWRSVDHFRDRKSVV